MNVASNVQIKMFFTQWLTNYLFYFGNCSRTVNQFSDFSWPLLRHNIYMYELSEIGTHYTLIWNQELPNRKLQNINLYKPDTLHLTSAKQLIWIHKRIRIIYIALYILHVVLPSYMTIWTTIMWPFSQCLKASPKLHVPEIRFSKNIIWNIFKCYLNILYKGMCLDIMFDVYLQFVKSCS